MAIQNFPLALQPIIQQGFLETQFQTGLESQIGYRDVADRMPISVRIGETVTKTRKGLIAPTTTPLAANVNTNFDNGLVPASWSVEQYTITIQSYGLTLDLNTVTEKVGLASQFVANAYNLGINSAQSLDRLARNALFAAYGTGNTRVRTTLGGNGVTINVDDVRGFETAYNLGGFTSAAAAIAAGFTPTFSAVSASNTLAVTVGSNVYTLTGAARDVPNVSTALVMGGVSGTLTFSTNVTVADGTAGNTVQAATASVVARPSGRANTSLLQATDTLTMSVLLDSVAILRKNAVPAIGGFYNAYLDPVSARQLFADPDFRQLFQGATSASDVFRKGMANDFLGLRLMPTTEAFTQAHPSLGGVTVRRPIIVGAGALIEGDFEGMGDEDAGNPLSEISMSDGVMHITRAPMDRLQQIIAQSWYWIGGFTAPTDITTNPTIIPTATNANFKRCVMVEHVG